MKDRMKLLVMVAVAALICIACMQTVSAETEDAQKKWIKDHTVNVKSTVLLTYEDEYLEITEIYTGNDLKKKTGLEKIVKSKKIPLEIGEIETKNKKEKVLVTKNEVILEDNGKEVLKIKKGEKKVFEKNKEVVLTKESDPYLTTTGIPDWTWPKVSCWFGICWYEMEDPINLVWQNTYKSEVKSEFPPDWTDYPYENTQYVFIGNKWVKADGIADDRYRFFGGHHARLWEIPGDTVIGNAHHDDAVFNYPIGHQVDDYEGAEEKVSNFYLNGWNVEADNLDLSNEYFSPFYNAYNNGSATLISK
ncbi:hypothetical protein [uncultured Methanolobus sp.]|uniref:hypothetical protein n=1 Tax=uncultured Methanolobus sp. TaxID=218300 RepID=UPI0029C84572|nr:hypothetical protein [uncultured Methanolobus sp.]